MTRMSNPRVPPAVPKQSIKKLKQVNPLIVRYYLIAYNILSALGWGCVLLLTVTHSLNSSEKISPPQSASSTLSHFISSIPFFKSSGYVSSVAFETRLPPTLLPLYRRATTTFASVGIQTAFVQSFAVLEVLHVLLGWVRSPLQTTAMQVTSRLFLVWGIVEQFNVVHTNILYTSMVFAWSATEVIRYSFYACSLLGYKPYCLLYLRYTTFYILYPLGASSEAFLIYATLPSSSPIPSLQSWIQGMWKPTDYVRALLFAIWWPGLYVMCTHMIAQRRKVLGDGANKQKGSKAN